MCMTQSCIENILYMFTLIKLYRGSLEAYITFLRAVKFKEWNKVEVDSP